MTAALILGGYLVVASAAAVVIGRALRGNSVGVPREPSCEWSQAAIDAEFQRLIPAFVTADSFALDAQINRMARGAL